MTTKQPLFTTAICRLPSAIFLTCRLCLWFACYWAIIGVVWRPPLASVVLITLSLLLLIAFEWASRWWTAKKLPPSPLLPSFPLPKGDIVQQTITRTKTAEGRDRLDGTFWVDFLAETKTTTVHIPFCPAFERVPNVQVFPVEETDVHFRILSPKTFGVRIDVRRNNLEVDRLCFAVVVTDTSE